MSPPFHFLQKVFLPLLAKMGAKVELNLKRFGFYPAGGGEIVMEVKAGCTLQPLHLQKRGDLLSAYAEAFSAGLPTHVPDRELEFVKQRMGWLDDQLIATPLDQKQGPGNVLFITLEHEFVTEIFTGFAERGVSAEAVANCAVKPAQRYLASEAAIDGYLADQLLLPMALAGEGGFVATDWTLHARTNAEIIKRFLSIDITSERSKDFFKVSLMTE